MENEYKCICPLCGRHIVSKKRHVTCKCGHLIYIRKWTEKDYRELLDPVFEALAFQGEIDDTGRILQEDD